MTEIHCKYLVLGSGFCGLGMAIKLKEAGLNDFLVLERAAEVGGTWRDNTYPGVACDVPANVYSYSFELNPNWSRIYAEGNEIQQYILHCTDKYGVRPHIHFGKEAVASTFDAKNSEWRVRTKDGDLYIAKFLISALGPLNKPKLPTLDGMDNFAGEIIHSGAWNKSVSLQGKKVAIVGTGASSIQIVPQIVDAVTQLTVFQRTAPWIMPKPDQEINAAQKERFRRRPLVQRLLRIYTETIIEILGPFVFHRGKFFKNKAESVAKKYLHRKVKDPVLRDKLVPNYRIGCKRVLFSSDWYPSIQKENVKLVCASVKSFSQNSVLDSDGNAHEADVVIFATGFEVPVAGTPHPIKGVEGKILSDEWREGAFAYKGMAVPNFPNLFLLLGPNTGPGHTSVLIYAEAQINFVIQALQFAEEKGCLTLGVKAQANEKYNRWLEQRMKKMVWTSGGCHSWYLTKSGKNTSLYPGFAAEYCLRARRFKPSDFSLTA